MNIINVKINHNELRYLLNIIKYETDKAYLSFSSNKIKIIFFNNEQGNIHKINLFYESYFHNLKNDETKTILFNPWLLFEEISNKQKYYNKFIKLSIIDNFKKIDTVD